MIAEKAEESESEREKMYFLYECIKNEIEPELHAWHAREKELLSARPFNFKLTFGRAAIYSSSSHTPIAMESSYTREQLKVSSFPLSRHPNSEIRV
jgi:hypothetical protein